MSDPIEVEIVSNCCKASVKEDEYLGKLIYRCDHCGMKCYPEERCAWCHGTGIRVVAGRVYANEPHMADIDEAPCPCKNKSNGDDN